MKHRRFLALITAILLMTNLSLTALADFWDLEQQGNLHINTNTDYHVTSTDGAGNNVTTSNTISVAPDVTTNVTLDNVHIDTGDSHGIDVGSGADVTLNLVGDNSVQNNSDNEKAAIHVGSGDLTITSDSGGTLFVENNSGEDSEDGGNSNDGAAIGSNMNEDMSGDITIGGNSSVIAESDEDGAGIGSGENGSLTGSVTIQDDAKVEAASGDNGAGIGTGELDATLDEDLNIYRDEEGNPIRGSSDMSGKIHITGNAQVAADSDDDGAGIGTGDDGQMTGSITIDGNSTVWAESEDRGAGIGTGENQDMNGSITIGGNANVTAVSDDNSAGIGAGEEGSIGENGSITIKDDASVTAVGDGSGSGIGAGGYYDFEETGEDEIDFEEMNGSITISGNAKVTAIGGSNGAAIGATGVGNMNGKIQILDNAQVTTGINADDDAGVSRNSDMNGFQVPDVIYTPDPDKAGIIGNSVPVPSADGTYIISAYSVINGIPGWDIESLASYVTFAKDLSNLTIVWGNDNTACRLIWNDDKDISALISSEASPTKLVEGKLSDSKLTDGIAADKILRACNLKYDSSYSGRSILRFHLGEELAGKTVEIRTMKDGKVSAKSVVVTASGIAAITVNTLGDFAVIAK